MKTCNMNSPTQQMMLKTQDVKTDLKQTGP